MYGSNLAIDPPIPQIEGMDKAPLQKSLLEQYEEIQDRERERKLYSLHAQDEANKWAIKFIFLIALPGVLSLSSLISGLVDLQFIDDFDDIHPIREICIGTGGIILTACSYKIYDCTKGCFKKIKEFWQKT